MRSRLTKRVDSRDEVMHAGCQKEQSVIFRVKRVDGQAKVTTDYCEEAGEIIKYVYVYVYVSTIKQQDDARPHCRLKIFIHHER